MSHMAQKSLLLDEWQIAPQFLHMRTQSVDASLPGSSAFEIFPMALLIFASSDRTEYPERSFHSAAIDGPGA